MLFDETLRMALVCLSTVAIYALQRSILSVTVPDTVWMWMTVLSALVFGVAMIFVARLLLDLFFPDVVALSLRAFARVTLALSLTLTFSYLLGNYNHTFFTCEEFELAGWMLPHGCRETRNSTP